MADGGASLSISPWVVQVIAALLVLLSVLAVRTGSRRRMGYDPWESAALLLICAVCALVLIVVVLVLGVSVS